ncbi:MAG: hypothetical protein ABR927_18575 [Bacteroidales bacterium]|jgi:hypothetical protein
MKIKIFTFCLLFVVIFFSCKKEEIGNIGNKNSTGTLLSKIMVNNQSTYEYLYNDSNLVSEEKSKFYLTIYNYNEKGQLVTSEYYSNDNVLSSNPKVFQAAINSTVWVTSANGANGGSMTYEYNDNGQLINATYSRPQSTNTEYSEFSYDANSRIGRQTMYWNGTATGYIDYTYDGKGNLIQEMLYNLPSAGVTELITTTQYDFDSELNPYKLSSRCQIPGINTNLNNIIKETYTIHMSASQGSDNVQITETSYEYNSMGYPVSKNGNVSFVY